MSTFNMTCEAIQATLPDYLDETLEPWLREAVQEHLGQCVTCAGLVRDLRNIQREAAALPDLVPQRDLWPTIARGIGTPVVAIPRVAKQQASLPAPRPAYRESRHGRRYQALWMGLAAAGLVIVTASSTYVLTVRSLRLNPTPNVAAAPPAKPEARPSSVDAGDSQIAITSPAASEAPATPEAGAIEPALVASVPDSAPRLAPPPKMAVESVATPVRATLARHSPANPVYENEAGRLEAIMAWRKSTLEPSTAAVIENSLRVIDAAIAQQKEALESNPENFMLSDKLTHALDKKVELLRRAAMLASNT